MHLLDTDTATHVLQGHAGVIQRLRSADDPAIYTTIITQAELMRGRIDYLLKATPEQLPNAQALFQITDEFLHSVKVIPLDEEAIEVSRRLAKTKGLKKIGRADLLIASIALARKATLVTRNLKHFQLIPDLEIENWVD